MSRDEDQIRFFHTGRRFLGSLLVCATSGVGAAQAAEERWAPSSAACSGELFTRSETPLIVAENAIRWFSFDCAMVSTYKVGQAWFLQARCLSDGRTTIIPIMLEPRGDRLRVGWNRESIIDMRRCDWTPAIGYHWAAPDAVQKGPGAEESR